MAAQGVLLVGRREDHELDLLDVSLGEADRTQLVEHVGLVLAAERVDRDLLADEVLGALEGTAVEDVVAREGLAVAAVVVEDGLIGAPELTSFSTAPPKAPPKSVCPVAADWMSCGPEMVLPTHLSLILPLK